MPGNAGEALSGALRGAGGRVCAGQRPFRSPGKMHPRTVGTKLGTNQALTLVLGQK